MPPVTIELPVHPSYHALNRARWEEVLCDPQVAGLLGKIETNRHGNILMMPPASGNHSEKQGEIVYLLRTLMEGKALPECPVSTCNGVRVADIGWFSTGRFGKVEGQSVFETAPEIWVEVLSPSNNPREMEEKKQLYFDADAEEVWFCSEEGDMDFFSRGNPDEPMPHSGLCPGFPHKID